MKPKKTLNLAIPQELLDEFNTVCAHYGHGKQKGMILSAAILMFMRADPHQQGRFLHDVMAMEIARGVKKMLEDKVRQAKTASPDHPSENTPAPDTQAHAQPRPPTDRQETPPDSLKTSHGFTTPPQRKAAKKAGQAVKGIAKLPSLDDIKDKKRPPR